MPNDRALPSSATASGPRKPRAFALPSLRQAWSQVHWFIGITAGSVLLVIGVTGGVLAFRDELLDRINPGVKSVTVRDAPVLSVEQVARSVMRAHGDRRIATITLYAEPGAAPRVGFAPPPGQRRGEVAYVDPYTGVMQGPLHGDDFFEWIESLHRWLLLPRETGRVVAGVLAACLFVMAASGLYLRWPRRPLAWRHWLTFDPALKGRPFLWGLHSVLGTWVLVLYLVSTTTGVYWAFDFVRDTIDGWAGAGRPERAATQPRPDRTGSPKASVSEQRGSVADDTGGRTRADLSAAWPAFRQRAGAWQQAIVRLPERASQPVRIDWLATDAPHERARNRMTIRAGGDVSQDDRYMDQAIGERLVSVIYPLHMGSYFGVAGRLAMAIGALSLPVFAVTGWMLYLGRRRQKHAVRVERRRLATGATAASAGLHPGTVLIAFASQSGQAERLALQSASLLQQAGLAVSVQSMERLVPARMLRHARVLLVASSFGDGDPPDGARRFARLLNDEDAPRFAGVRFGVLALGHRGYASFCGFGHALERRLAALGAEALFPLIEVDDGDPAAVTRWSRSLATMAGADEHGTLEPSIAVSEAPYETCTLVRRALLNRGSAGGPLYEIALSNDGAATWGPGALAEVLPVQPPGAVAAWLARTGLDGTTLVVHGDEPCTLADLLGRSELPESIGAPTSTAACAEALKPLTPRRYSIASLPSDGAMQLLVRQERHAWGLGLASGWLTEHAPLHGAIRVRRVDNPSFEPASDDVPCLFIGNGSGLAGLRAHLRARVVADHRQNWLLFGERQRAYDNLCSDEIERWRASGHLARLDRVYSRDGDAHRYVQDRLRDAAGDVLAWVAQDAIVFVCGSLDGMAGGIDDALADILGRDGLEDLIAAGRYRRDVYRRSVRP